MEENENKRKWKKISLLGFFSFFFYCFLFPTRHRRTFCVNSSRRYAYEVRHVIFHFGEDFSFMRKVNEFVRMPAVLALWISMVIKMMNYQTAFDVHSMFRLSFCVFFSAKSENINEKRQRFLPLGISGMCPGAGRG